MPAASVVLEPAPVTAPVGRRTGDSFMEQRGRCVYTGVRGPGRPLADEDGFRTDVLALTRDSVETNEVSIDEFAPWAGRAEVEIMHGSVLHTWLHSPTYPTPRVPWNAIRPRQRGAAR